VKRLILSLIFAVIASTIGAGWVISQFHSAIYNNADKVDKNIATYKQLGKAIGMTLDDHLHQRELIEFWEANSDLSTSIQELIDFPVPENLSQEFANGTPLLLESDGEMSLHVYMKKSDQVLTILLPVQNASAKKTPLNLILTLLFYFVVIVVLLDSYIFEIEKEFNRMANQIQKLIDDNKLLSRAVSHNLKTPITRLRMGVDVLEETKEQAAIDEYIKRINNDLDEMQSLVETLLQYSKLDEFNLKLKKEHIDLRRFIPELFDNAVAGNIKVSMFFSGNNLDISTDPRYLTMQLNNIMANAMQYAKNSIEVRVGLCKSDRQNSTVSILIEDDGSGIPYAERVQVIKPFWRGDNNTAVRGHGMGLAIVSRIASWLKAELVIRDSVSLGGACVGLYFAKY